MKLDMRFVVRSVNDLVSGREYTLGAVFSTDPKSPNKKFWEATPSGDIRFVLAKDKVPHRLLKPGQEVTVSIVEDE
jgi:hypothetical protein